MPRVALRVVAGVVMVVLLFLSLPLVCAHGHAHDHAHGHAHEEPPAFKWSKEANEAYQDVGGAEDHAHTHSHAHANPQHAENHAHSHSHSHAHDHSHSHSHSHAHVKSQATDDHAHAHAHPKPSVWMEALTATLAISIAPYLILFFIPVTNSKAHEPYLKALLAFASGGLLGDAFLHLIPHALIAQASSGSHSHSHTHSHSGEGHGHDMGIGLAVLGGIIAFLVVEKIVRIFKGGHSHSHAHTHTVKEANGDTAKAEGEKSKKGDKAAEKKKNDKKNSKQMDKKSEGTIKVAGYLNLAADFTHNLTDGLAIGASFLAGKSVGMVTTFTIFLHEIPHEIGDFAILLQSGCSRKKAMMLQLVTAVGALTGTCISLLAEGADESAVAWVLPFTAGGFIYIATVSVIPELLENTSFWQSVVEIVALLSGVMLMMAIAHLEELSEHEH